MRHFKSITLFVLAMALFMLPQKSFAASSTFQYCNNSKANAIMIKTLRITGALGALKATLAAIWGVETVRVVTKNDLQKVVKSLSYLDTTAGKFIPPMRNALKALLPTLKRLKDGVDAPSGIWSNTVGKTFVGSLRSSASSMRGSATRSPLAPFFTGVFRLFTVWDVTAALVISYATVNKSVCAIIKAANPHCQKGAKDKNKCTLTPSTFSDLPSGDDVPMQSIETKSCSKATAAAAYINYLQQLAPLVNQLKNIDNKLSALIDPLEKAAVSASSALKPLKSPMNGVKSALTIFKKTMIPFTYTANLLQKAMNKKICVTLKIKVGKIKKRTKKCSRIKNAIKDIKKMAKPFEKPMKAAMDKVLDPILNKLLKGLGKLPGLSHFSNAARKISSKMSFANKLGSKMTSIKNLNLSSIVTKLKSASTKLSSLKNQMASAR